MRTWLDDVIVPALVREFLLGGKRTSPVLSDASSDAVAYAACDKETEDTR
jgi:hypothetical protein